MPDPFLKWAGGKRWLVARYPDLFPASYSRYVEPFLGGGAVFFHLEPSSALLADANSELVRTYEALREEPAAIDALLREHQLLHSHEHYYLVRSQSPRDPVERAARFIYLNRTCFNGLYRENKFGLFNVPKGVKTLVQYEAGYLESIAGTLSNAELIVADFEGVLDRTEAGDFVYVDPPYTVAHNSNNFIKYNAKLFSWQDQERLATAIRRAAARGALIMLSNADHPAVAALYEGFGTHRRLSRASVLAADSGRRRPTSELLVTNY